MRCSSGNMSQRVDDKIMLVKASRAWMCQATADDVAVCRIEDGSSLNGKRPSVEIGFHAGVLRARADVNVVLHFQTPAATTLACSRPPETFFVIPEIPYYIGRIGLVPYITPGSAELATAVTQCLSSHNLAIMANHGQVTVGQTIEEAIQRAVFFELACDIILRAGNQVAPLSESAAIALMNSGGV